MAVDDLRFSIPRGAVVGFLGPNGAGKTTTLRMLAGTLAPTAGTVAIDGIDLFSAPRRARRLIGYLPEGTPLLPELRVEEFLRYRTRLQGLAGRGLVAAVNRALDQCTLAGVRRRLIGHLSKGYRQRVGLAAALVHEPSLVLLDEPTSGLDPGQVQEFRALLRSLAGRHTILLSSHVLPEIEASCDRVLMIERGRLVADGSLQELRQQVRGARRLALEARGDAAAALAHLPGVAAIRALGSDGDWRRLEIDPASTAGDLRAPVAEALARAGIAVRELSPREVSLEELFLALAAGTAPGIDGERPPAAGAAERRS